MAYSEPCTAACGRLVWPGETEMKAYAMSFDGALLGRGFWLYVWRITDGSRSVLYVGRTGDSSSPHASYPHFGQIWGLRDRFGNELEFPAAFRQSRRDGNPRGIVKIGGAP